MVTGEQELMNGSSKLSGFLLRDGSRRFT